MLAVFIKRPVLSTVISILLILLGAISLFNLPMTQFPDIAPPSIQVTASYPGANAEVVAKSVATPIEEAVNGVEDMMYMSSNSNNDGSLSLTIFFKVGTDPDKAAVNVQNRVAKALPLLPPEVIQAGVSTQKLQNSMIFIPVLYSTNPEYDEVFLQNYVKINLLPEIQRVNGVGQAISFGIKDYAMRIWLQPDQLTAANVSPQEVVMALQKQNLEASPGRLGQNSNEPFEYTLKYKGKHTQPADYEALVIRVNDDGSFVRLKDLARVEFGSFNYGIDNRMDGKPAVGIAVFQAAGSNANAIQIEANKVLEKAAREFPKGIQLKTIYATKEYLDESIAQVKETLVEAFILVFLVVLVFLQDWRSTLIPAIAVPVAIVGTFFFLQLFGFSINLLTLFALILAIGIVVDDAIVVVEAVHTQLHQGAPSAIVATNTALKEITGAIISITLVMAAVFLPVAFMQGPAGVFYRQFAITLAIAIIISAVNALTLTPALAALFLKPVHSQKDSSFKKRSWSTNFAAGFNAGFSGLTNRYLSVVQFFFRKSWLAFLAWIVVGSLVIYFYRTTPVGFIPSEDQSFVAINITLPPGSSLQRTQALIQKVENDLTRMPAVQNYFSIAGLNLLTNANSSNYGVIFVRLKDNKDRGPVQDIPAIVTEMNGSFAGLLEGQIFAFTLPTVPGFGNVDGFEVVLQDRSNGSLQELEATAQFFIGQLMQAPELGFAFTTFSSNNPQYELIVAEDRAAQLGVDLDQLFTTLQIYLGSIYGSDFNRFGKFYRVILQGEVSSRKNEADLNGLYVKNKQNSMVPISELVQLKKVLGPEFISRNNLFQSVTINGFVKPGFSSGDAIQAVERIASIHLPKGYAIQWTGISKEEKDAGSQAAYIFILCVVFVYFLLAAQYESYILPLAVLLSLPFGILGVFAAIRIFGIDNNIYVQVGLIMLVGLLAKNAILIVEFALQRRRAGATIQAASLEAARLRLRPILMTSLAFIAGLIPLSLAEGSSAMGNKSISIGAMGGMISGVLLGLFVIPVFFNVFQLLHEKLNRSFNKRQIDVAE